MKVVLVWSGGDISNFNSHKLCSVSWTLTLFLGMYQATNQELNNNKLIHKITSIAALGSFTQRRSLVGKSTKQLGAGEGIFYLRSFRTLRCKYEGTGLCSAIREWDDCMAGHVWSLSPADKVGLGRGWCDLVLIITVRVQWIKLIILWTVSINSQGGGDQGWISLYSLAARIYSKVWWVERRENSWGENVNFWCKKFGGLIRESCHL